MHLLLIEDSQRVVDFLERGLRAEGYNVTTTNRGCDGFDLASDGDFDAIILDLRLPDMHGHEICRDLRARQVATPILMLTAMDAVEQRIEGLRLGADDYVVKPFVFDELLARIEALIRRSKAFEPKLAALAIGDLVFDWNAMIVRRGEVPIELTAKELALLEMLMSRPNGLVSRSQILNTVWGYTADPLTNVVDVYIGRLRKKIDDGHLPSLIRTMRGFGYKLEVPAP